MEAISGLVKVLFLVAEVSFLGRLFWMLVGFIEVREQEKHNDNPVMSPVFLSTYRCQCWYCDQRPRRKGE